MKMIVGFSRYFVGILFIISGLIKLNDPVGTQIKMEEYFEVLHIPFFIPYALFISVFMCVAEVMLGVALLLWFQIRATAWALLAMIIFFTFLTFYSAYFNKVTDCGCFGDAIKLTPWTSFSKDVVLLIMILFITLRTDVFKSKWDNQVGLVLMGTVTLLSLGLAMYCIMHLSIIDFRAYKVGNHIPTLMKPSCEPKYTYVLEKDGNIQEFDKYPTDTSFQFKEMKLANPECMPKITDYSVWNDEGDYTQETFKGNKLMVVAYQVQKASSSNMADIKALIASTKDTDITPIFITASDKKATEDFLSTHRLDIPVYYADGVVIKTMIRSIPGLIYLQNGTVKGKWHHNDTPTIEQLLSIQ